MVILLIRHSFNKVVICLEDHPKRFSSSLIDVMSMGMIDKIQTK